MQCKLILMQSSRGNIQGLRDIPACCRLLKRQHRFYSRMLILLTCSVILLFVVSNLSHAGNRVNDTDSEIYSNEPSPDSLSNLKALLKNLILPNIPGAVMLLIMSSLFSGINFYTAVKSKRRPFRFMARYLIVWIIFNYLFALLVLILILPNDMSLNMINKTLFVYCLVATAMPEVAANMRLQLGDSTNAIDLYKYKNKVSDLITERLGISVAEQRSKDLMALAYFYYKRLDQFLDKLAILSNQGNLSNEETVDINAFVENLKGQPVDGKPGRVIELEREYHRIVPKLIYFFRDDIRRFNSSPVADLMDKLHPLLDIDEARKLVQAGITSTKRFLWRCRFTSIKKRIAATTGIDADRLSNLYYSTRVTERKQMVSRFKKLGAAVCMCVIVMWAIYWIQLRSQFRVDETTKDQIVKKPLPKDEWFTESVDVPAPPSSKTSTTGVSE